MPEPTPVKPAKPRRMWAIVASNGYIYAWSIQDTRASTICQWERKTRGAWGRDRRIDGYRCIRVTITPESEHA